MLAEREQTLPHRAWLLTNCIGGQSRISSTFFPLSPKTSARFQQIVDFPTPPLSLNTEIILAMLISLPNRCAMRIINRLLYHMLESITLHRKVLENCETRSFDVCICRAFLVVLGGVASGPREGAGAMPG